MRWNFLVPGASETDAVTVFDPPRHLAFGWSDGIDVDIRFATRGGDAIVVTVVASGFPRDKDAIGATEGFSIVLCDLKTLLDSGKSAHLVLDKASLMASAGAMATPTK